MNTSQDEIRRILEARMEVLEELENPTYSQQYELSIVYFQLSEVYEALGMKKEAADYKTFSKTEIGEVIEKTEKDPIYLREAREMYEHFGEEMPADLRAVIQKHEDAVKKFKKGRGVFSGLLGNSLPKKLAGTHKIECETVEDSLVKLGRVREAARFKGQADEIAARNYKEDLAKAVERALLKGLYVASLDDHELVVGVERDYLETILTHEELEDVKGLRERVLSGNIDLSQMPEEFSQFDFGEGIEVDEEFANQIGKDVKKVDYLEAKIEKAQDPREKEALVLLRDKIQDSLVVRDLMIENPTLLVSLGYGTEVSGPSSIGTSDERKKFYFKTVATRILKQYIPELKHRMKGVLGDSEDTHAGWRFLKERFPVFEEVEAIGTLPIARAFKEMGYKGMEEAVRGLINTSDGTPHSDGSNAVVGLLRRTVDTVRKIGYNTQARRSLDCRGEQ